MSTAATVVVVVAAFAAFLTLAALARVLLRRSPPTWRRFRVGVFLERDGDDAA